MSWQLTPHPVRVAAPTDGTSHLWGVAVDCIREEVHHTAYCFIGRASLLSHEPAILTWEPAQIAECITQIACTAVRDRLASPVRDDFVLFL